MKHFKHSYSELAKVGQRYYNDSGYCAVLATAVVCDLSFGKALSFSKKVGRQHRKGSSLQMIRTMLSLNNKILTELPADIHGKTLKTVGRNASATTGRYLYLVKGHIAAVRDGILEDWSTDSSRRVLAVWQVN